MTTARVRRAGAALVALAVAAVLTAGFPGAASAHTTLIAQSPKANATVAAPRAVTLTFADRVIQPGVVVRTDAGRRVDKGDTSADGPKVTTSLPRLAPGRYQVGWRVVAPDGHVQTGEFRFGVPDRTGAVPASTAAGAKGGSSGPPVWLWIALAGVVVLVGGGLVAVRRALR
ncbi:MAG TPA: copper resistance protein CopC [Streptosporangiaceae bacterium]